VKVKPFITVITAVFNGAKTLEETILSVINQTYNNVEYIIIDGGSTDGTLDIIKGYEHAIDYWVSEKDEGIYDAWNKGIRIASGQWIAFLGADDVYIDGALEVYANLAVECNSSQFDYISSRVNLMSENKILRTIGQQWNWKTFRRYMNVAHVGSLHNRKLFEKYGMYNTNYKICGDYELLLRARSELKAVFLNSTTVNMSIGGASDNSSALSEMARAKVGSGRRNYLLSRFDLIMATIKLRMRKLFWY
jgi:glycosyltransferase involved in cell wall biosynthesis